MRGAVSLINMGEGACGSKFLISYSWTTSAHLRRTQPVIGRVIRGMDAASELNWIELRQDAVLDNDGIVSAYIARKRPHEYTVVTTQQLAAEKYNAGVELLNAGKAAEAEALLLEALKIAPRDRQILDALALALSQQDRLKDAAKYLQRGVDGDPHSPDAHHHLGKVLGALGRLDVARNHYEVAIKLKPDYVDARLDLGDLLRKEGKFDAAVAQYSECLKYTPNAALIQDRLREVQEVNAKPDVNAKPE
jgi:tetratricopeptide (TPR) repeat protein